VSTPKKSALGKGFDALIPQNFDKSLLLDEGERVQQISIEDLQPNPDQPRQHFDRQTLEQLAESIKLYGIIQPLVVMPGKPGTYILIAGERRWRAAQMAKLQKVPAVVRTSKELERLEIAIVENVQRVNLSPLEQAISIEKLHQQFGMTYEAVAKRLGKAPSTINNTVRLLQLPEDARQALHEKKITEGHARAILALKDLPEKQSQLLKDILKKGWSVREAERFVTSVKEGFSEIKATRKRMRSETPATKKLSKRVGSPVHIRRTAKGGKIEITFYSDEQLEAILGML
jgi:ParB family transcriptional regulator, chromosome partitioning protein